MIAYDVQSSDVIETAVATESSISTFVSKNTTTLLKLLYSVSKNSYIFNNDNQATLAFITALNCSIFNGTFDNQLHIISAAMGNNDVQTITIVHVTCFASCSFWNFSTYTL